MNDDSEYKVKEQLDAIGGTLGPAASSPSSGGLGGDLPGAGGRAVAESVIRENDIQSLLQALDYMKLIRGLYKRAHILIIAILGMLLLVAYPAIRSLSTSGAFSAKAVIRYHQVGDKAVSQAGSLFELDQFQETTALDMIVYPNNLSDLAEFLGPDYFAYDLRDSIEISADRRRAELVGVRVSDMPDEETAIRAANAFADVVVKNSDLEYRAIATEKYEEFKKQRIELDGQLREQEQLIQEFQLKHGILDFSTQHEVYLATMNSASTRLSDAKVNLNILEARIKALKSRAAELPDEVSQATLEDNPISRRIFNAETALTEARTQYAESNPKVLRLEREIAELKKLLVSSANDDSASQSTVANPKKLELQGDVEQLESDKLVEVQRVAQLQTEFERLQGEYRKMPLLEKEYKALLEKKTELDELSMSFKASEQAARLTLENNLSDFLVLEQADYAMFTRSSLGKVLLVLAVFLGFVGGLVVMVILELMDQKLRTVKQLELAYTVPCLAAIPAIDGLTPDKEYQQFLPFVRDISERLATLLRGRKVKGIGFFSSMDQEGKSALSLNLARYYVSLGRKVCYVNFNEDEPAPLAAQQKAWRALGVENYLKEEVPFEEVVSTFEGLDVLQVSTPSSSLVDLFVGAPMARLKDLLVSKYDVVVVEAPAVLANAESGMIASLVDLFVYVVGSPVADKRYINSCLKFLQQRGHAPFAMLLNRADPYYLGDVRLGAQAAGTLTKQ